MKHVADEYLSYIAEEINTTKDSSTTQRGGMTVGQLFEDMTLRKQLIVGITVQLMMQFSGIDAVFYYSTKVFYQAGVSDPELATTGLGVINVIVTIFAVKFMDTTGRKTLLTYSWIGMFASYLLLTTSFVLKPYLSYMDQLSVFSMTGVIVFFAFGPGCIAWFMYVPNDRSVVIVDVLEHLTQSPHRSHGTELPKSFHCMLEIQPWLLAYSSTGWQTGLLLFSFPFCSNIRNRLHFFALCPQLRTFYTLP